MFQVLLEESLKDGAIWHAGRAEAAADALRPFSHVLLATTVYYAAVARALTAPVDIETKQPNSAWGLEACAVQSASNTHTLLIRGATPPLEYLHQMKNKCLQSSRAE